MHMGGYDATGRYEEYLGPTKEQLDYQGVVREVGERGGVQYRTTQSTTILMALVESHLLDEEHGAAGRYYRGVKEAYQANFYASTGGHKGDGRERTMADDYLYFCRRVQPRHLKAVDHACFTPEGNPFGYFGLPQIIHAFHRLVEIRDEITEIHRRLNEKNT